MTRSGEDVDRLIREALEESDAELRDRLGEPSLPQLLGDAFRGRHRLYVAGGAVATGVFFLLGVAAAVAFLGAAELRRMLVWAAAAAVCFGLVGLIKIWIWLEMTRQSLLRDVKRLELQVALLAGKTTERTAAGGDR